MDRSRSKRPPVPTRMNLEVGGISNLESLKAAKFKLKITLEHHNQNDLKFLSKFFHQESHWESLY